MEAELGTESLGEQMLRPPRHTHTHTLELRAVTIDGI